MGKKTLVFWVVNIQLLVILILVLFFAKEFLPSIGVTIVGALVANGAAYAGFQVADGWQKSKYYNAELANVEGN